MTALAAHRGFRSRRDRAMDAVLCGGGGGAWSGGVLVSSVARCRIGVRRRRAGGDARAAGGAGDIGDAAERSRARPDRGRERADAAEGGADQAARAGGRGRAADPRAADARRRRPSRAPPTAQPSVTMPAVAALPTPGAEVVPAAVLRRWQSALVAHIERFKRYPAGGARPKRARRRPRRLQHRP